MFNENCCIREAKREAKQRRREEKREAKFRRREEKREAKFRRREEKREAKCRRREEFLNGVAQLFGPEQNNVVVGYPSSSDVRYNNFSEMPPGRIEQDVATLRAMFPDCDPEFIRNCLMSEPDDNLQLQRVAEKLLRTDYPKAITSSPLSPPTAPPLPVRNSFDEAPPSYEETMRNSGNTLRPPPIPPRNHRRTSSWNGTSTSLQTQISQRSREVGDTINTTVKNLITSFKPSSVEQSCYSSSSVWARPVPSRFKPKSFKTYQAIPKDKYSIQRGFIPDATYKKDLRSHDVSGTDWNQFISGLNSVMGVNSVNGVSKSLGGGFSVGLKWVQWMNVSMDERLMDDNISTMNEYIARWNDSFFIPRRVMVQLIDDRTSTSASLYHYKNKKPIQYLSVSST